MKSWPVRGGRRGDADEQLFRKLGRTDDKMLLTKDDLPKLEVLVRRTVERIWDVPHGIEPDPAVPTTITDANGKRRTVYVQPFLMRLLQRCFEDAVHEDAEKALPDTCHAYRRGHDRFTALEEVRKLVREGFHYVIAPDIKQYFPYCTPDVVFGVLERQPWLGKQMRTIARWFMRTPVMPRPKPGELIDPGEHWYKPAPHLLQGAPIAGWLANLVGAEWIDKPMAEMAKEVRLPRYSDNMIIAAKTPSECMSGLGKLRRLLDGAGLQLHDVDYQPIDVHKHRVNWLGKIIHGTSIRTPNPVVNKLIADIVRAPLASDDYRCRQLCGELYGELRLERDRVPYVLRHLKRDGGVKDTVFAEVAKLWNPAKAIAEHEDEVTIWDAED